MTDQNKINEHSRTPWKRYGDGDGVFSAADEYVADFFLRADEDFALLAVNSHEELVKVCRHALIDLEGLALRDKPYLSNGIAETIRKLKAVITKASGGDEMTAEQEKHTPGPWIWEPLMGAGGSPGFSLTGYAGWGVLWCDEKNATTRKQDAYLIAAAPDLLAAAKNLENDDWSIPAHAWELLQAAIAKAEGRTAK